MVSDKMLEFIINSVRREGQLDRDKEDNPNKALFLSCFRIDRKAGELIEPSRQRAQYHREREIYYMTKLEGEEKELRENGISIEVFDQSTGTYQNVASGSITGGPSSQQFQPRVDQKLLDNVKNAKAKMLEHRTKAEDYEKWAKAFSCSPETLMRLSVNDIYYFRLES